MTQQKYRYIRIHKLSHANQIEEKLTKVRTMHRSLNSRLKLQEQALNKKKMQEERYLHL